MIGDPYVVFLLDITVRTQFSNLEVYLGNVCTLLEKLYANQKVQVSIIVFGSLSSLGGCSYRIYPPRLLSDAFISIVRLFSMQANTKHRGSDTAFLDAMIAALEILDGRVDSRAKHILLFTASDIPNVLNNTQRESASIGSFFNDLPEYDHMGYGDVAQAILQRNIKLSTLTLSYLPGIEKFHQEASQNETNASIPLQNPEHAVFLSGFSPPSANRLKRSSDTIQSPPSSNEQRDAAHKRQKTESQASITQSDSNLLSAISAMSNQAPAINASIRPDSNDEAARTSIPDQRILGWQQRRQGVLEQLHKLVAQLKQQLAVGKIDAKGYDLAHERIQAGARKQLDIIARELAGSEQGRDNTSSLNQTNSSTAETHGSSSTLLANRTQPPIAKVEQPSAIQIEQPVSVWTGQLSITGNSQTATAVATAIYAQNNKVHLAELSSISWPPCLDFGHRLPIDNSSLQQFVTVNHCPHVVIMPPPNTTFAAWQRHHGLPTDQGAAEKNQNVFNALLNMLSKNKVIAWIPFGQGEENTGIMLAPQTTKIIGIIFQNTPLPQSFLQQSVQQQPQSQPQSVAPKISAPPPQFQAAPQSFDTNAMIANLRLQFNQSQAQQNFLNALQQPQ